MSFIEQAHRKDRPQGCVLCELQEQEDGPENLILARGTHAYVIMNRYPYNCGHLMVVPKAHGSDFSALSQECGSELHAWLQKSAGVLQHVYAPQGMNVGMNLGAAGGAGIPSHLHYHIVPRWNGDTNFMPVIGQTKVLPETLEETYRKLSGQFSSI